MEKKPVSDRGLVSDDRPGSMDVTGQQKELFPFDAFEFIVDEDIELFAVRMKVPWVFLLEESIPDLSAIDWSEYVNAIFAEDIVLLGQLRANYTAAGNIIDPDLAGIWISSLGKLKANFAEFVGTLRTGPNAATDARVAIQDQSGILSGPTFTGTGLDDLSIVADGAVDGTWDVMIESVEILTYAIGDTGPAGGRIVYVDPNGTFALEAAPSTEWFEDIEWGGSESGVGHTEIGDTSALFGKGGDNTDAIYTALGDSPDYGPSIYAARSILSLTYGGFSDWYLMSKNEATAIFNENRDYLVAQTGESSPTFWTSTEVSDQAAWVVVTYSGTFNLSDINAKSNPYFWAIPIRTVYAQDTFKYRKDAGAWSAEIDIPASKQYEIPSTEITIGFNSRTFHTVGDYWTFTQGAMRGLSIRDSAGNEYFAANDGVTTIDGIDIYEASHRAGLLNIERKGSASYAGLGIRFSSTAFWNLMANQGLCGLYDDANNKWGILWYKNGELRLYYNGSEKLNTRSDGVQVTGTLYASNYSGDVEGVRFRNATFSSTTDGNQTITFNNSFPGISKSVATSMSGLISSRTASTFRFDRLNDYDGTDTVDYVAVGT